MVRITTPTLKDVACLDKIKKTLIEKGYTQPLVADVHFQPRVAEEAAKIVEKVRINPGNYVPEKYNGPRELDPQVQQEETEKIRKRILPLITICKKHNTAIRIGVNHGSLSERILNWYGDTPEGMVQSALEFLQVFHEENFHNLVISLKASSSRIMVHANRLLVKRMFELDYHYPIHLGVTEAGDETDGRIKSATGICALLNDGIGDTIRVSLTEDPEEEIPVAKLIAETTQRMKSVSELIIHPPSFFKPFHYQKSYSHPVKNIGGESPPIVINSISASDPEKILLRQFGYSLKADGTLQSESTASDYIYYQDNEMYFSPPEGIQLIIDGDKWKESDKDIKNNPLFNYHEKLEIPKNPGICFLKIQPGINPEQIKLLSAKKQNLVFLLDLSDSDVISVAREFFQNRSQLSSPVPVVLYRKYNSKNAEELMIRSSAELGALILDGFGDGVWIEELNPQISTGIIREISFSILQACGARISKTEYISCPSCGRTLFDIQSTLKKIKQATSEFTGLKIGVMGCIVNGPGEMADADFGYVGAGKGLISLYKGKEQVKKNIPEAEAVNELLKLIRKSMS
jgi:(E)-4-hydroxy-3-methylbut-2-enyl-diphosphate synthase